MIVGAQLPLTISTHLRQEQTQKAFLKYLQRESSEKKNDVRTPN
jgi:hypothetical protein